MYFQDKLQRLQNRYESIISKPNKVNESFYNGIYDRYENPILTASHVPISWKYDLNENTNPFLQERLGINAVLNPGAIYLDNKYYLMCRVEGMDRKSFFALAVSNKPTEGFEFIDKPIIMPQTSIKDTNVYDMRLTQHEDGFIYGLFCTERKDPSANLGDESSAVAACGIARTKDLINWERLADLKANSSQQRNVVLHPEFVNGKYALYTRPQDSFIDAGKGGGIGFALCENMLNASVDFEDIFDAKVYHTINEVKNGQGPTPIKTEKGWLHIAHGVRNTAAGLRYVLYVLLTDLHNPKKVLAKPSGYLIAPEGEERVGDVSNVVFCNGVIKNNENDIYIYYASSDTRIHVASSTIEKLLDYAINTPQDPYYTYDCVMQRRELIAKNINK